MLSCKNLTVLPAGSSTPILDCASVNFKKGAMNAVIGPSGCGKTTLVKAMLKIIDSTGESFCDGKIINSSEELVGRVGFAPQFTCAHPMLTVSEAVSGALEIAGVPAKSREQRLLQILETVGLTEHSEKLVGSLSGGQLRRIGLGIELAGDPAVLCCDEVTSGLDPLSENSILDLLRGLCDKRAKTFVCIIHNLAKLDYFDTITVIHRGNVVFSGTLDELKAHFKIDNALSLYDRLNECETSHWLELRKNVNSSADFVSEHIEANAPDAGNSPQTESLDSVDNPESSESRLRPGFFSQLAMLLRRRYLLFFRDSSYLLLTLAITFGFPIVVVIFAIGGLPQIESLALDRSLGALDELRESLKMQISAANTSAIVTGLILFQVVLLSLMGANNSAREIAGERALYEKERLLGLRAGAYACSKVIFTSSLAIFQGIWMCAFVKFVCKFPGAFPLQAADLAMSCVAMTAVCLAFSALFNSAEKANVVSIYLVGFQLPLSGVVLALPEALKWVCRPFISTYWGWAGYMSSMRDTRIYDAFIQTRAVFEYLPDTYISIIVMGLQTLLAILLVFYGCKSKKWS